MALITTVHFEQPQREIASLIHNRISQSSATSIVTGFATRGGLEMIAGPIRMMPERLKTLVVGAATYPGFEALDELLAAGVRPDRLHIHLGHTYQTGTRNNPFARYHPMLHSKVYYMELPNAQACAFVGSHNMTSFALGGLNGEAGILLEGAADLPEFEQIRCHIETARLQSVRYSSNMKEAYTWWLREYLDGLRVEVGFLTDWTAARTILLFAEAKRGDRPKMGDNIYFEIPNGIGIDSLKRTETHLFLFDSLPATPMDALQSASSAVARYVCETLGVENMQGNREIIAQWRIDRMARPVLTPVLSGTYRPSTASDMQQVRAKIEDGGIEPFEYLFDRQKIGWDPEFSGEHGVQNQFPDHNTNPKLTEKVRKFARKSPESFSGQWKLVTALVAREGSVKESDEAALKLAAPESGSFVLVSLRKRKTDRFMSHD